MTNVEIIEQLENAIELIKQNGKDWLDDRDIPILEACIKSLMTLDKIRAEIEALPKTYPFVNHIDMYVKEDDVKKIIDKYKAESE